MTLRPTGRKRLSRPLPRDNCILFHSRHSILNTHSLLPTPHSPLPTPHSPLLTTHYSLLTSLLTTQDSLLTTHNSLLTTHCSRLTAHYPLLTTHYSLHTTHSPLLTPHSVPPHCHCLSMQEPLCWAIQVAFGIEFLHHSAVIHGDLKPKNVLVYSGRFNSDFHVNLRCGPRTAPSYCSRLAITYLLLTIYYEGCVIWVRAYRPSGEPA